MANYVQKLEDAIIAAHEAGDYEAAQTLADELKAWKPARADKSASTVATDFGKGALRGAADIGNTLINLSTFIPRKLSPELDKLNSEREASLKDWTDANNPEGLDAFDVGRVGANIAGTAGAGGVLGKAMQVTPALAKLAPVVESGGFNLGRDAATTLGGKVADIALRTAGGAVQGGVQSALVDPASAGTGAVWGAATPGAIKLAGWAGGLGKDAITGTARHFLGASTGAGADAVSEAYRAGKNGSQAFLENMRGDVPFDDVVQQARSAVQSMRAAKSEAYRSGMIDIKNDKTVLNFSPIDKTLSGIKSMGSFKGQKISDEAASTVQKLIGKVDEWKSLDPAEFHTPEGMDALKQAVGDILADTKPNSTSQVAARQVYNSIKSQIEMQAPTYSKVMKDYGKASELIKEIEGALSLGQKAKADTAIRKLQSLMRNNAQTNYGNRQELMRQLEEQGGAELMPAIAGQAMNSWMPRGMIGAVEKAGMVGSVPLGFSGAAAAVAPFTSPRIVGEAAYGLGRAAGGTRNLANSAVNKIGGNNVSGLLDESIYARTLPLSILGYQGSQR